MFEIHPFKAPEDFIEVFLLNPYSCVLNQDLQQKSTAGLNVPRICTADREINASVISILYSVCKEVLDYQPHTHFVSKINVRQVFINVNVKFEVFGFCSECDHAADVIQNGA